MLPEAHQQRWNPYLMASSSVRQTLSRIAMFHFTFESVTAALWQGDNLQQVLFRQNRMNSDMRGQITVADVASCCSCSQCIHADSHQQTSALGKMLQCCMKQKQPSLCTSCQANLCR